MKKNAPPGTIDRDEVLDRLQDTHIAASSRMPQSQWQQRFNLDGRQLLPDPEPIDHLEHFKSAVLMGAIPSPESLLFMALAIDEYLRGKGEKSLDDAMLRPPSRKRVSNTSRQRARDLERAGQLWGMAFLIAAAKPKKLSIEDAAAQVLAGDPLLKGHATLVKAYSTCDFGPRAEHSLQQLLQSENKPV